MRLGLFRFIYELRFAVKVSPSMKLADAITMELGRPKISKLRKFGLIERRNSE